VKDALESGQELERLQSWKAAADDADTLEIPCGEHPVEAILLMGYMDIEVPLEMLLLILKRTGHDMPMEGRHGLTPWRFARPTEASCSGGVGEVRRSSSLRR